MDVAPLEPPTLSPSLVRLPIKGGNGKVRGERVGVEVFLLSTNALFLDDGVAPIL